MGPPGYCKGVLWPVAHTIVLWSPEYEAATEVLRPSSLVLGESSLVDNLFGLGSEEGLGKSLIL